MTADPLIAIPIALGLGLLAGLERERGNTHVAGLRTFALLTVLGTVCGLASSPMPWLAPAGLLAVAAVLVAGYVMKVQTDDTGTGLTTSIAALVMYGVGVLLGLGHIAGALLATGSTMALLQWKAPLHLAARRMKPGEMRAVTRLVLIALVLLPVLPNEDYGPYGVLNPFEIWLVVSLICGISLASYLAQRLFGSSTGTLLAGALGGMISSTATTVSYARMSKRGSLAAAITATVIMVASAVVFIRVIAEIAVIAPDTLPDIVPQLAAMATWTGLIAAGLWLLMPKTDVPSEAPTEDPLELKAALVFGLLYVAVLLAVAMAQHHLGDAGLYTVAAISGLTDMDAITVSAAQMLERDRIDPAIGWRMIIIGAMSNLVFKAGIVAVLGSGRATLRVAIAFVLTIAGGAAILIFWPDAA